MNRRLTRQVAVGAATAVLAAGGGVAYAASSGSGPDGPERPFVDGPRFAYGEAVPALPAKPGERVRRAHGDVVFGPAAPLEGAADYLGLTEDELHERLQDGRTLAEIARAEGRSVDGLKDALLDAARERLDEAVEDGPLTEEQRDELLRGLESRIDDLIEGRLPPPPRFFGGDGPRFHRFGDCGPRDEQDGRSGERGSQERRDEVAPAPDPSEQGSTTPGNWDGAASGTVSA